MEEKKKQSPPDSLSWPRWPRMTVPGMRGQLRWVDRIVWWFVVLYLVGGWVYLLFLGVALWRIGFFRW